MTFSIAARCPDTGMFGCAVTSSSPAVAARCAYAKAGVGAVLTQNFTDPTLGRRGLELIERGATGREAIAILSATASDSAFRQLSAIGGIGPAAGFTGGQCLAQTAQAFGVNSVAVGNLLSDTKVTEAMIDGFETATGHLAARLIEALRRGRDAGGEIDDVRSAGVIVVHQLPWPIVDLRVDWNEVCPIDALFDLWSVWEPRMPLYLQRALSPADAPASDVSAGNAR
ncbi:DUF1028 domain-containing protein [Rhizobium rhizogenes]|uniref:DUF1028 domain-containing protein n=1 Tax=Rhizobium rhizogenes TaxID=359 RepID=UPI001571C69E|nr:DUF1028 domain-containing protein [Rhizobium rhizogenes]NTH22900.1 DUF1028 domain-containing protein [Rhizobium rhizogenes]NTH35929.1 DUF1028 domain-containing protein [Rhizobium rhizogenes]